MKQSAGEEVVDFRWMHPISRASHTGHETLRAAHELVVLELLRVDAVRVVEVGVHFSHADAARARPVQVTHRVHAHVAEALRAIAQAIRFSGYDASIGS